MVLQKHMLKTFRIEAMLRRKRIRSAEHATGRKADDELGVGHCGLFVQALSQSGPSRRQRWENAKSTNHTITKNVHKLLPKPDPRTIKCRKFAVPGIKEKTGTYKHDAVQNWPQLVPQTFKDRNSPAPGNKEENLEDTNMMLYRTGHASYTRYFATNQ